MWGWVVWDQVWSWVVFCLSDVEPGWYWVGWCGTSYGAGWCWVWLMCGWMVWGLGDMGLGAVGPVMELGGVVSEWCGVGWCGTTSGIGWSWVWVMWGWVVWGLGDEGLAGMGPPIGLGGCGTRCGVEQHWVWLMCCWVVWGLGDVGLGRVGPPVGLGGVGPGMVWSGVGSEWYGVGCCGAWVMWGWVAMGAGMVLDGVGPGWWGIGWCGTSSGWLVILGVGGLGGCGTIYVVMAWVMWDWIGCCGAAVGLYLQEPGLGLLLGASISARKGQPVVPVPCLSLLVSHGVGIPWVQPQLHPCMLLSVFPTAEKHCSHRAQHQPLLLPEDSPVPGMWLKRSRALAHPGSG